MKQNHEKNNIKEISGDIQTTGFNIEVNSSMFQMLTSNVYNDPILAVVREWSTNACDACIAADTEVKYDVHLPTVEEKIFSVRDYGTGLSPEDIVGLFSNLGASTKRDSDKYNGTLGIGRMSGLAVSNSFTVDSYHNGSLYSYVISVQNGIPVTMALGESVTDEPNGLKLSVSVNSDDIYAYREKAEQLYKYFDYKPNLNLSDVVVDLDISNHISDEWFIEKAQYGNTRNSVVMSQVAYEIPYNSKIENHGFSNLVMKVPPGSVTFNPGRESLSLNTETIDFLNSLFIRIRDEYIEKVTSAFALADNDRELVGAYILAKQNAPYSLRNFIDISPFVSNEYTNMAYINNDGDKSYNWVTCSPDFYSATGFKLDLSYKDQRHVTAKKLGSTITRISAQDFFKANHVIIDLKSNFRSPLNTEYHKQPLVTWQKSKDTELEEAVEEAKTYLTALGIDYKLASEIVKTAKVENNKVQIARQGLYISKYNSYRDTFAKSSKLSADLAEHPTVYVKLSHVTPLVDDCPATEFRDMYSIYSKVLELLPYKVENEDGEEEEQKVLFWGVPKKYLKLAEELDNWMEITDYLKAALQRLTLIKPLDVELPFFNTTLINMDNIDQYPEDLQEYFLEITAYRHFNSANRCIKNLNQIKILEEYGATFESYVPTLDVDLDQIENVYKETLPLIADMTISCSPNLPIRLSNLEAFYEIHRDS